MLKRVIQRFGRARSRHFRMRTLCLVITTGCIFVGAPCFATEEKGSTMDEKVQTERFDRGLKALRSLDAEASKRVRDGLKDIAPEMAGFIVEFAYGDVYTRPGLDPKSRQVATIAALTAMGNAKPQLKFHIGAGLNAGLSPREIIEVIYVTTVFSGFPSGLNGIGAAREVFQARGVTVEPDASSRKGKTSRRERGLDTMNHTSKGAGERVIASLADIAPEMADFIIDFSYGDIFSRKYLSPQHKELAMLAVCVAKGTMEPQMRVHIHAALNVGCTKEQIVELMNHMAVYAGFPAALNGLSQVRTVFEETTKKQPGS